MKYLLVFLAGAIPWLEIAAVVPVGIVIGLSPFWVMLAAALGNLITVMLVILGFEKVKEWREQRKKDEDKTPTKKQARAKRVFDKYGMPGVALIGPLLIGTHLAAFIGLVFGAKKSTVTMWMTISIIVWTLVLGILTAMGFEFFVNDSLREKLSNE